MIYDFFYSYTLGDGCVVRDPQGDNLDVLYNQDWSPIGRVQVEGNSIVVTQNLIDVRSRFNDGWDYNYLDTDSPVLNAWLNSKPGCRSFEDWVASAQVRVSG